MHAPALAALRALVPFGLVTLLGLITDVGLARTLQTWVGLPWMAALIGGFTVAAGQNYVLLARWVYPRPISLRGYLQLLLANAAVLPVRLGVIQMAVWAGLAPRSWLALGAAVGTSFAVNFVITHCWVMRPQAKTSP